VLVNVTFDLMPGTPELTALGRKASKALVRGLLDNASDSVRALCAGVLSETRDPETSPALVEALRDRSEVVRQYAIAGLGNLADPKLGGSILDVIENPEESEWIKRSAIAAVGNIGYVKGQKALFELVRDEESTLGWDAVRALWHMRNKAGRGDLVKTFMFVLEKDRDGSATVVDYLGELKAVEAANALASYYVGRSEPVKNDVIIAMGKVGNGKAQEFLKEVMRTTQVARHLNNAAIAMAKMGQRKETIGILNSLLKDKKAYMRVNAAFALGEIAASEDEAVQALIEALDDKNDYVRSEASVALGRIKAPKAAPRLEQLANGSNPFVALDAVIALNRIDYGKYRQLIFDKLLIHKKLELQRIVQRGIRFLAEQKDPAALPFLLGSLRSPGNQGYSSSLDLLTGFEKSALGPFEPSITYMTHTCTWNCLTSLLRTVRAHKLATQVPALLERLYRTYSEADKSSIYFSLGKIAPRESAGEIEKLQEKYHTARLYRLFALANLGNEEAQQTLFDFVKDGTLDDKRDAAFLLGALDSKAMVAPLKELMKQGDPFTAVAAAAALLGLGDETAAAFLYDVMRNGTPIVADEAERAFRIAAADSIEEFLKTAAGKEKDIVTKRRSEEILYQRAPKEFR
jgi:HEAT repeat protein